MRHNLHIQEKLMSWIFFILRFVGVLMKICSEINFLKIMYGSNFTVTMSILYFLQILVKAFWNRHFSRNIQIWTFSFYRFFKAPYKLHKNVKHQYCPNIMYQKPLPEASPKFCTCNFRRGRFLGHILLIFLSFFVNLIINPDYTLDFVQR